MAEPAQQEMFDLVVVGGGQEPLELDGAVAGGHLGDDLAAGDIQGRVQVGDPMAGGVAWVVMPTSGIGRAGGGKHAGLAHDWTSSVDKARE